MKLSAIVITKNEEAAIDRCLNSLAFANERIVVDSGSTDRTIARAEAAGASVLTRPWTGYGDQKNFAAQAAQSEWVAFVDADEEVPPALAQEIQAAVHQADVPVFWFKIVTVFLGRPLYHLYGHNPRLFNKNQARWTSDAVHEQAMLLSGQRVSLGDEHSQVLQHPLLHHSHPTLASYFQTMHQYTTLEASDMAKTHRHRSGRTVKNTWWLPAWLASRQFIKLTFYRRGWLDGWAGLVWCGVSAYYEWEVAQKYRQLCA
jgi:glycosyltransferase involved in cell wall biosynthesis